MLDDKALIEIVRGEEPNASSAYRQGSSIRYWDPSKQRCVMAQNWPAPNTSYAFLDQLQGLDRHGRVQVFSGVTDTEGNPRVRRHTFSDIAPDRLRWDDAGRIVLNANPELTIASDFSPPAWLGNVVPEDPQQPTVWTETSEDRIVFEHQARGPGGDWMPEAIFELAKQSD